MAANKRSKKYVVIGAIFLVIAGVGGFYHFQKPADAKDAPSAQQQQAMPVDVAIVKTQPISIWKSFSARMQAVNYAQLRPQVSGTIAEIRFEDGQDVEKGDVLYVMDPRPYEAIVNQIKAELNAAKNNATLANKELKRAEGLIKSNAVSKRIYDERVSSNDIAQATVQGVQARLDRAQIDLDYAYVKAPFSGRVGRAEITKGNLVEAGPNAPVLTTIVSDEGIYADFEVDEQTYLTHIRNVAKNQKAEANIPVRISIPQTGEKLEGFMHSFDNVIDNSSGTIRARAFLPNTNNELLPGMYANVEIGSAAPQNVIVITERAIMTDQDRKIVMLVGEGNTVTPRPVSVGESINGKRIITSGLNEGDKVIVEGVMRIRPGMPVTPQVVSE